MVGQFDNCLFSLHKPQSIGRTNEKDIKDGECARMVIYSFLIRSPLTDFSVDPVPHRRCSY